MSTADSTDSGSGSGEQQGSGSSRKWRLRPRLLLAIAIPTVAVVALGAMSVVHSSQNAVADQRSEALASLSIKVSQLALQIEDERDATVWYIAAGPDGRAGTLSPHPGAAASFAKGQLQIVQQQEHYADSAVKAVLTGLAGAGSGYSGGVQSVSRAAVSQLRRLPQLRSLALKTQVAATDVLADYGKLVSTLLTFDDEVARSSIDPQFASTVRSMATISRYEYENSEQRAIIMYGLTSGSLNQEMLGLLTASIGSQKADVSDFQNFATASQSAMFENALARSLEDRAQGDEQAFLQNTNDIAKAAIVPTDWFGASSSVITATYKYEKALASSAVDRARAQRERAIISAIVIGGIVLLVLVLSLLLAGFIGRSMAEPPHRLNSVRLRRQPRAAGA
jgi:hypothetical protein